MGLLYTGREGSASSRGGDAQAPSRGAVDPCLEAPGDVKWLFFSIVV